MADLKSSDNQSLVGKGIKHDYLYKTLNNSQINESSQNYDYPIDTANLKINTGPESERKQEEANIAPKMVLYTSNSPIFSK